MKSSYLKILFALDLFLFIVLTLSVRTHSHFMIDLTVTRFFQHYIGEQVSRFMILISLPGYGIYKYLILILVTLGLSFFRQKYKASMLLFSSLGAEVLSIIIKSSIGRARPDKTLIDYIYHSEKSFSYPSGHVVYYVGFFGFLFFLSLKINNKIGRVLACAICLLFLILVGPSRIYLGAHWFTDVLGGYLAGVAWLLISILLYNSWTKNEKSKDKADI